MTLVAPVMNALLFRNCSPWPPFETLGCSDVVWIVYVRVSGCLFQRVIRSIALAIKAERLTSTLMDDDIAVAYTRLLKCGCSNAVA